jgi:hypothetical protein
MPKIQTKIEVKMKRRQYTFSLLDNLCFLSDILEYDYCHGNFDPIRTNSRRLK